MALKCILIFTLFLHCFVASNADSSDLEAYWNTRLGNAPMPSAIKENLVPSSGANNTQPRPDAPPVTVNVYKCGSPQTQTKPDDTITSLFFSKKELQRGHKMNLHFPKSPKSTSFLPRPVAETIPFSFSKFDQILAHFNVKRDSPAAHLMNETLESCKPLVALKNENYCATSLESMIDYVTSNLGNKDVRAYSSVVPPETTTGMQSYTILGVKKLGDGAHSAISCHKSYYPYTVFVCHKRPSTSPYLVSLIGKNGMKIEAAAVCHEDTSEWNPEFIAFKVLNSKVGTPVCHFMYQYNVLWVHN